MAEKKNAACVEDMVTIVVPREPGTVGDDMYFVALNGKAYNIPRGKPVQLPAPVAAVYYESIAAQDAAFMHIDEFQQEMRTVQGAPC